MRAGTGVAARAAIYTRVSTRHQAESGFSLEDQREKLVALAEDRGWVYEVYEDAGESGESVDGRPELVRLLSAVDDGEIDWVLVVDDSRLARDELVSAVVRDRLRRAGVKLLTPAGERDLADPADNFMSSILGAASTFEQQLRSQKTFTGVRKAAEKGHWTGGPAPFGYRLVREDGHTRVEVDPVEQNVILTAANHIIDEGGTTWTASKLLNSLGLMPRKARRWTHENVRKVLRAPYLEGFIIWAKPSKRRVTDQPPIKIPLPLLIDPGRRAQLLAALDASSTGPRRKNNVYPLSGHLFGQCGARYHGVYRDDKRHSYYRCRNGRIEADPRCADRNLNADDVNFVVWEAIEQLLTHPENLLAMAREYLGIREGQMETERDQAKALDAKIAQREEGLHGAAAEALRGVLDPEVVKAAAAEVQAELDTLRARRTQLEGWHASNAEKSDRMRDLWELAEVAHQRLGSMTKAEQKVVIGLLGIRVDIVSFATKDEPAQLRIQGTVDERLLIDSITSVEPGHLSSGDPRSSTWCRR